MLYRKVITEFEAWFKGTNKKALFVQGARQVGKTTTIREFCRSHYENFIELNFIKKPRALKNPLQARRRGILACAISSLIFGSLRYYL